ncbi:MAG: ABC transporter substrate-binding protein [Bauldia sp.]|nr:ABC transporter substrate-binding protein [Bauldia sp.]
MTYRTTETHTPRREIRPSHRPFAVSRRTFGLGALSLAASAALLRGANAQAAMRTVSTILGETAIPVDPQRVIAIDSRLDLEPAVALGLPIAGYCDAVAPWVPVAASARQLAFPPNIEEILSLDPDLAICTDVEGAEDMWPLRRLSSFMPTLPIDYEATWQENLTRLGGWLQREAAAAEFIAGYDAALEAMRQRHGARIADRKVAAVYYNVGEGSVNILLGANTVNVTLAGQVLEDLGGRTVPAEQLGETPTVSLENIGIILGDVEAILVDWYTEVEKTELAANLAWQRLPAVAAGRVRFSTNIYYGGCYSALHLADEWDALYAMIP